MSYKKKHHWEDKKVLAKICNNYKLSVVFIRGMNIAFHPFPTIPRLFEGRY